MSIRTSFVNPPIPYRNHDWQAWFDGLEETSIVGWGKTEPQAVRDLFSYAEINDRPDLIELWPVKEECK